MLTVLSLRCFIAQIEAAEDAADLALETRLCAEKRELRESMKDACKGMRSAEAALVAATKMRYQTIRTIVSKRREDDALNSLGTFSSRSAAPGFSM